MTLVRIALFKSDPSGVDVPVDGSLLWKPSKRRHVEDPEDHIVLPASFTVRLGQPFLDDEGEVVTPGEPGIAWVEVDPTEVPDWAWTVAERTDRGRGTTWLEVPDDVQVEYADLIALDPDTLDPAEEPQAAWDLALEALDERVDILEGGAASLPPGGADGEVLTKQSAADGDADWEPLSGGATGGAGGVLSGTYPNPGFAVDMAEQSELNSHVANTSNPHSVTKAQVGLGNVDNVQQQPLDADLTAIAALSPSNDDIIQRVSGSWVNRTMAQLKTALGLTKSDVGLANVDNTSDANKPISTATQAALDDKFDDSIATDRILGRDTAGTGAVEQLTVGPGLAIGSGALSAEVTQSEVDAKKTDSMATNKLLGRGTAGTGAIEEITLGTNLSLSGTTLNATGGSGGGDVSGPASADDNAVARFDGTTGKIIQDGSPVTISDAGVIAGGSMAKADVGLGNVDNTSDANKPVSTAQQTALDGKQPLDSDLTTIAGLSPSNDDIVQRKAGAWTNRTPAQVKTDLALTKTDVGLANVDNTSDANKPVSTAQQAALDAEAALARNADNLTSGTVADARIAATIARDSEVTAAVAAEAALARNGDNITSGTVADARIASTIARDSEVTAAVAAEATARDAAILARKWVQPNTVALLGASISNMGGGTGVGIYDTPVASPLTRVDGFFAWANVSLGGRLTLTKNAGVNGNTSAQILARVTDVTNLAVLPGYCILADCASNDLIANTASATIITNLQAICDALQAKGITVVICTVSPIAGTTAHMQRQEEVNRWIRDRVGQPGFIVCDWAARWADPTTAGPKTGFATDGVHPTPVGAGALGRVLADAMRPHLGGSVLLASHNLDQLAVNLNPMMVGTSGTASTGTSGSVATNWITLRGSGAGTLTAAKVARADGIGGEWQQVTLAGGGGQFFLYSDVAAAGISGEKWQAEMEFEAADFSGITDCRVVVEALTSGQSGLGLYQLTPTALPTDISSGVIRTPVFTVPAGGPFGLRTMLVFQGTAGSIKVSRFRTRKVA